MEWITDEGYALQLQQFEKGQFYKECPQYLQEQGHIVGCQIPLRNTEHFNYFSTKLSVDGRYSVSKNYSNLIKRVKLNTPYNLSLEWTPTSDLCLQWVNSYKKLRCMEFKVRYQRDSDPLQSYSVQSSTVYCIPLASKVVNYTFQVKSRIGQYCGTSDIWSEWSEPVQWGNSSEPLSLFSWQLCISISGCILLIVLGGLLCYCERVRILPVFPDPSKNLQDLFQKHNGNVESWVYVSRELKEAFEPDYTESSCLVYESTPTLKAIECDGPSQQQPSS
ncbi:interleukin 2 receptor, gamma b isoform X2 [Hoplias malabaricus]|uniref:interleukin 2 receptor, gamma b isoform X2 n=1 Tax=Hoplias malabaricus TaxID=27720 RepID=UPI003461DC6C